MSTPHLESTTRQAIDKGSVSGWRQKVKEIGRRRTEAGDTLPRPRSGGRQRRDYRIV